MKLRYVTLASAGTVLAGLLAACSTTAPGTSGAPGTPGNPPPSASCEDGRRHVDVARLQRQHLQRQHPQRQHPQRQHPGAMGIPAQDMSELDAASSYSSNGSDDVCVDGTVDNGAGSMVHWPAIDVPFFVTGAISVDSPVTSHAHALARHLRAPGRGDQAEPG